MRSNRNIKCLPSAEPEQPHNMDSIPRAWEEPDGRERERLIEGKRERERDGERDRERMGEREREKYLSLLLYLRNRGTLVT